MVSTVVPNAVPSMKFYIVSCLALFLIPKVGPLYGTNVYIYIYIYDAILYTIRCTTYSMKSGTICLVRYMVPDMVLNMILHILSNQVADFVHICFCILITCGTILEVSTSQLIEVWGGRCLPPLSGKD